MVLVADSQIYQIRCYGFGPFLTKLLLGSYSASCRTVSCNQKIVRKLLKNFPNLFNLLFFRWQ